VPDKSTAGDERIAIHGEDDIVLARSRAREIARLVGFGMVDQSRIATAVSELTRNIVRYAADGSGEVIIRQLAGRADGAGSPGGIEIVAADEGPGIPDIELAMREGYTSGPGMGLGLPGTKRLMDEMEIESASGTGTVVTIRKWRR
jgi:serine/threonine-protein kinase RsbT